jgi:hypothetical protein
MYKSFHLASVNFPKQERYVLGEEVRREMLGILRESLLAAATSPSAVQTKLAHLKRASVNLEALKLLLQLCKDCHCLSNSSYQEFESRIAETGRMLGGWIKSFKAPKSP